MTTPATHAIRILIVDDHAMFREGLAGLLDREPDIQVIGKCESAAQALVQLEKALPTMVLLDFDLGSERAMDFVMEATRRGFTGRILVVTAGTSDIPVAEEAVVTAETMGNRVEAVYDVGVAGLHRLLEHRKKLAEARVIVCVAGMEGALPSVVAGLVAVPVIAVPTSTGYGSSFGGLTALLGMLNSCASNVSVVNIDNGFGAGCVASVINRL